MKLVILTTQTLHHAHFVRQIAQQIDIAAVMVEKQVLSASFDTHHPFEDEREIFEKELWFSDGTGSNISDWAQTETFNSINDTAAITCLDKVDPDLVVVFGTGRIHPELIQACRGKMLNLHGGDPEYYRGLDSHLWAIYHNDFSNFIVTLHTVNEQLDDGLIVQKETLDIIPGTRLEEVRSLTTQSCVRLTLGACDMYKRSKEIICHPQKKKGRYYSFMPAVLKEICYNKFSKRMA